MDNSQWNIGRGVIAISAEKPNAGDQVEQKCESCDNILIGERMANWCPYCWLAQVQSYNLGEMVTVTWVPKMHGHWKKPTDHKCRCCHESKELADAFELLGALT